MKALRKPASEDRVVGARPRLSSRGNLARFAGLDFYRRG